MGGNWSSCLHTSCQTDFVSVAQVTTLLPHSYAARSLITVGRHSSERERENKKEWWWTVTEVYNQRTVP